MPGPKDINKMIGFFKKIFWHIIEGACDVLLKYVPGLQEACDEVVAQLCRPLLEIHLLLPTSGLFFIPDHLKTQEMCDKEMDIEPCFLRLVPNRLKTQGMCDKAVHNEPWLLKYVPDWFVTHQQAKLWDDHCINDRYIKWYDCYKKRKAQKAQIKEELMPIAWHPSRYWDWGMSEDEKKRNRKIMGINIGLSVSCDRIQKIFLSIKFDPYPTLRT